MFGEDLRKFLLIVIFERLGPLSIQSSQKFSDDCPTGRFSIKRKNFETRDITAQT